MKIGIFDNHLHFNEWNALLNSCVVASGNTPVLVKNSIDGIDAIIVVGMCWYNYNNSHLISECIENNIPVIMMDSGIHYNYWTICVNRDKRLGIEYTEDLKYDDSRNRNFLGGFNYKDWNWNTRLKGSGKVTLLIHYLEGYEHISTVEQQREEIRKAYNFLSDNGYKPSILEHPRARKIRIPNVTSISDLNQAINDSEFCVSWHSNALCHAIISGVPSICLSEDSFAYPMSSNSLEDEMVCPDRSLWINQMSWCHFNKREIVSGIPLKAILNSGIYV